MVDFNEFPPEKLVLLLLKRDPDKVVDTLLLLLSFLPINVRNAILSYIRGELVNSFQAEKDQTEQTASQGMAQLEEIIVGLQNMDFE